MLVPPVNFGIVEENLYRCSKLETLNLSFIENLGLKLIIFLMTEEPSRIFKEFMKSMQIEWIYISNTAYGASNSLFLIHPKVIHQVFNLILDKSNNNILLVDKTALLVGMLRKIQKWQLSSIIDEYRMITGKHKSYNAECFLEFVKIEIMQ
ncbi:protein-tyrosine phosphatase, partial [Hanseniaspora valbyensis NRRL Y-1626]